MSEPRFPAPRLVVVKIGSSSLRAADGGLDTALVAAIVDQIAALHRLGTRVVLVSSGAVAAGLRPLGLASRPTDLPTLQAAASVGQGALIHRYQADFARFAIPCGQVLLTPGDIVDRARYLNARHTFERLLALGAVPVVNENDTVATDELRFGDNDRLAALVASMLSATLLTLLSDVDGLLPAHPREASATGRQRPLERVDDLDELDARHRGTVGSAVGSGGMASKLEAARIATFSGASAVIANARRPAVLADVVAGAPVGTWFPPSRHRPESRKLWIAFAPVPRGRLVIDAGAVRALRERGSSLLAAGILDSEGDFEAGDAVDIADGSGRVVARGLVSYGAAQVRRMRGRSRAVTPVTAGGQARAVVHRDVLVVVA